MDVNVLGEVDIISGEQIAEQEKAEKEANLVAEGTWEGQVISWNKRDESEKGDNSPYKGVPEYRVGLMFYDCPEAGKKKTGFFTMTTHKVLNDSGRPRAAYTTAVGLVKAMHMEGQPFQDVLEQAKVTRVKYKVGQFTPQDGNTMNFLKAVSAA